jgi:hypothetical protein
LSGRGLLAGLLGHRTADVDQLRQTETMMEAGPPVLPIA